MMFSGDVVMTVLSPANAITAPADMGDVEFHRRRVARKTDGPVAGLPREPGRAHARKRVCGNRVCGDSWARYLHHLLRSQAAGKPDDAAEDPDLVDAALVIAVGGVVG